MQNLFSFLYLVSFSLVSLFGQIVLATGYSSLQNTSLDAPKTDASLVGDLNHCVTSFQLTSELDEKINQPKFSCGGTGHQTKMAEESDPNNTYSRTLDKVYLVFNSSQFPALNTPCELCCNRCCGLWLSVLVLLVLLTLLGPCTVLETLF